MLRSALRVVLLTLLTIAVLVVPVAAFPLVPGEVVRISGDYGPSGLFTDTGFRVDTVTGAMTPVPGYPAEGFRVAVGASGDLFVLTREPLPNEPNSRSVIWRVNPETGAATKLFGSFGAGDLTVVGSTPFVAPLNGDAMASHYLGIDASLDGVVARLTTSFVFTLNLINPPLGFGFCTPCPGPASSSLTAEGFPGWGGDLPFNGPRDLAWGYGHTLYVSTFENIHIFDVDANRWLGFLCEDCEGGRITVFTPVTAPGAWWLLGLGAVGLAGRIAVVNVRVR